ncbi:MAG: SAM-dependent methyltransferase [Bacteroidales bacterium]|jgi:ubiquinone/menaquinone biosynthesis C-methylase UbiE|nr:SAM-dependent methyltransferase [Bacteroidales bacterium]
MKTLDKKDKQKNQQEMYSTDDMTALQAQFKAQEIAFAPIVFQVARLMLKWGIFELLDTHKKGLTMEEIVEKTALSEYAVKVLLESALTAKLVLKGINEPQFTLSKTAWFLLHDEMVKVNLNFNHDVNYLGMFELEQSLIEGKPVGLKVFGDWKTIYEGLSQLPNQVQKSWFAFDHFYSDNAFDAALKIVFTSKTSTLLDVGGNTGKFASRCVAYSPQVKVTIMDLPQQIALMRQQTQNVAGNDRIFAHPADLLDITTVFPTGFDVIWMSQFLDCFSKEQVISILSRVSDAMSSSTRLYIMETLWDRQRFPTASFCLAQISLYFTALANGNSKMFNFNDIQSYIESVGLNIVAIYDQLGLGHSLLEVRKK